MNFDFKCDKSYYRSFNYFINKRYKIYIFSFNIIDKKFIIKINTYFYYKYRNFYIKKFIKNFNHFRKIIYVAIEIF